jgi:hypothetical protein
MVGSDPDSLRPSCAASGHLERRHIYLLSEQFEKTQDFDLSHAANRIRQVARRLVVLANESRRIGQIRSSALPEDYRVRAKHQSSKVRQAKGGRIRWHCTVMTSLSTAH